MNGMAVLLLLESLAKVGILALFAQTALPGNDQASDERDFGWQISKEDGALEYIVQITPEDATAMATRDLENPSQMPVELVGRATRIVVRIGRGILPRSPSLEELRQMPRYNSASDVTASLDPGRFSDVEGTVRPTQNGNGGSLTLPTLPSNTPALDSIKDFADQSLDRFSQSIDQAGSELSNRFLEGARQSNPAGPGSTLPTLPPTANIPGLDSRPTPSTRDTSAPPPGGYVAPAPAQGRNPIPSAPGVDRWAGDTPSQPMLPPANDPRTLGDPYASTALPNGDGYPQTNPSAQRDPYAPNLAQRGQMPGRSLSDNIPGNNGWGASALNNPALNNQGTPISTSNQGAGYAYPQYPPAQDPAYYGNIAQRDPNLVPRGELPKTAPSDTPTATDKSIEEDSPSSKGSTSSGVARRSSDNFLPVFFLLSLVVNLYLGMLIRKLLSRYRALLASVRSQAA